MNPIDTLETALHTDQPLTVEDTARLRDLAAALDARALDRYEDSTAWSDDGHTSPTSGVRYRCNQSAGTARSRLRLARTLGQFDHLRGALEAGEIGLDAVHALLRHDTESLHDRLVEDQKRLVEKATELEYADLVAELAMWAQINDPDGADEDAAQRQESRSANKTKFAGNTHVDATLPGIGGIEWGMELDRIEQDLFQADWAEARNRLGDKATKGDLRRTKTQRAADAMVEMARRSAEYGRTMADEHGNVPLAPRARVVVNLIQDLETFIAEMAKLVGNPIPYPETRICEFDDGTPVTPSEALGLALGGEVRRVVYGTDGHILDFGRSRRLFTGAIAEAIRLHHRTCQHPGCGVPATKCQIDHGNRSCASVPSSFAFGETSQLTRPTVRNPQPLENQQPAQIPRAQRGSPPQVQKKRPTPPLNPAHPNLDNQIAKPRKRTHRPQVVGMSGSMPATPTTSPTQSQVG